MTPNRRKRRRRGIVLAEAAIIFPVAILLIMGTIVAGLGMFRYHQVASLAREGARWASVHGPKYQEEQKRSAPVAGEVVAQAVTPEMAGLNPASLTSALTWNTAATPPTVTFTLNYRWVPEAILAPASFTSTSTQLITY